MVDNPRRSRLNRLRGGAPAEPSEEKKVIEIDFSKSDQRTAYIKTKLDDILDKIGQSYGKMMTDELMKRLDQTIAEFHSEVIQVLSRLEGLEEERKKAAVTTQQPKEEEEVPEGETDEAAEMSEFEKRLERMEKEKEQKKQALKAEEEDEKPKKKGLFRRK
jgi:hypothetical protein